VSDLACHEVENEDEESVWPAFVDLFAATSLLFITLLGVYVYFAAVREGQFRTTYQEIKRVLEAGGSRLSSTVAPPSNWQSLAGTSSLFEIDTTDKQFVKLILRERATFPTGRYKWENLRPEGKEILRDIGARLSRPSVDSLYREVQVVGHTDQVPYLSDGFTNWELSAARAAVVARFLVSEVGLDPCKVSAIGRGPFFPEDTTGSPDLESNRRIEIQIIPRQLRNLSGTTCKRAGDGTGVRKP
jgi:flagellar motor protein MotB